MTPLNTTKDNEYLVRRCKSKDTHDFPNLEDESRCPNCKLWEEVDAYVATKCNAMLDRLMKQSIYDQETRTEAVPIEAIEAERKK